MKIHDHLNINLVLLLTICLASQAFYATNGLTHSFSGGRFGDNLLAYCHARWLAYKHQLEFYYKPFRYSDKLALHEAHKRYEEHSKLTTVAIKNVNDFSPSTTDNTLYVVSPFPANNKIRWNDPTFFNLIHDEIRSIQPLSKIEIPKNLFSVAIHVRRGGGWDLQLFQSDSIVTAQRTKQRKFEIGSHSYADKKYPKRFPPDAYYIEQLQYVLKKFADKTIYVHIFTDDPNPELIARKYKEAINNPKIIFGCRTSDNRHDSNVLEDFFGIMQFDCLIRPKSNYSTMAGSIGRVKLEISPKKCRWEEDKLIITLVEILERDKEEKWKTTKTYVSAGNSLSELGSQAL